MLPFCLVFLMALPAAAAISIVPLGQYSAQSFGTGAAEIPAYDPLSQRLFIVNGATRAVDVVDVSNPSAPVLITSIPVSGEPTSVAIRNGVVAVSVVNGVNRQLAGEVVFFNTQGTPALLTRQSVGAVPDMLTFTPDGKKLLVANEGEPSGYGGTNVDPDGSISVLHLNFPATGQVEVTANGTVGFTHLNGQEDALRSRGVRIYGPGASASQDLEPEYIAVSADSSKAFVTLQENNAIAIIDLATESVTNVVGLGYKDHSLPGNGLDSSSRDNATGTGSALHIANRPFFGVYSPDAIASYHHNGQTYLFTANEGESRGYLATNGGFAFIEETILGLSSYDLDNTVFGPQEAVLKGFGPDGSGSMRVSSKLGDTDGDGDFDQIYIFGGRSISVWSERGEFIYDTGNEFESYLAAQHPTHFNVDVASNTPDARSASKGIEPEGLAVGVVNGTPYLFIVAERNSSIFAYDISDPTRPTFAAYVNTRDFTEIPGLNSGGDNAPEGIAFIPAELSPNGLPMLAVAFEYSGTTRLYAVVPEPSVAWMGGVFATLALLRRRRACSLGSFCSVAVSKPRRSHRVVPFWR